MQQPSQEPSRIKKKKLSSKEIFRTIAFEYRQDDKISIDLIGEIVSNMFYPRQVTGEARKRYKQLLVNVLKEHARFEKTIGETDFCKAMDQASKMVTEEYNQQFCDKIYERFRDRENNHGEIDSVRFQALTKAMKIDNELQSKEMYKSVTDTQEGISVERFRQFLK